MKKQFSEHFRVYGQVFRKSGNTWLLTTSSDEWTLAEQNEMAKTISTISSEQAKKDDDYDHEQL